MRTIQLPDGLERVARVLAWTLFSLVLLGCSRQPASPAPSPSPVMTPRISVTPVPTRAPATETAIPGSGESPAPYPAAATALPPASPLVAYPEPPPEHTPLPTPSPTTTPTGPAPATPLPPEMTERQPLDCRVETPWRICQDEVLDLTFQVPAPWGPIETQLEPGLTGVRYRYYFNGLPGNLPGLLQAGGLSLGYTAERDGTVTDFSGFSTDSLAERCRPFYRPAICEEVGPHIVFMVAFPDAGQICLPGQFSLEAPLAITAVDLTGQEPVSGFVIAGEVLSVLALDLLQEDIDELQREDAAVGKTACDETSRAAFNARMLERVAGLRNGLLDPQTNENMAVWREVAASFQPMEP